jgi:hypothetical protein
MKFYLSNASRYCLFDILSSDELGKVGGTHSIVWILQILKMLFQADEKVTPIECRTLLPVIGQSQDW